MNTINSKLVSHEIAEEIMNTKLYLTKEEYDFCFEHLDDIAIDTSHIGDYFDHGAYLNLRLYKEDEDENSELKLKHESIRSILIKNGNVEYGDCIIDEICDVVGILPTTTYYSEEK
jgi:hypothetical protein